MARPAKASDEQIIEAYEFLRKQNGGDPLPGTIRGLVGASHGLIERVILEYKNAGLSYESYLKASKDDARRELNRWLTRALKPVAEKLQQKSIDDMEAVREEYTDQAKQDCKTIASLQKQLKKSNTTVEQLQDGLEDAKAAHKHAMALNTEQQIKLNENAEQTGQLKEKLETAESTVKEQARDFAHMRKNYDKAIQGHHEKFEALSGSYHKALSAHEATLNLLNSDLQEKKAKLQSCETLKEEAITQLQLAEKARDEFQEDFEVERSAREASQETASERFKIIETRDNDILELTADVQRLNEDIKTHDSKNKALTLDLKKLERAANVLSEKRITLERANAKLETQLSVKTKD